MLSKKFCPNCGSEEVRMVASGMTGAWMCKKCGFSGSIFPEKEIIGGNMNENLKSKTIKEEKKTGEKR